MTVPGRPVVSHPLEAEADTRGPVRGAEGDDDEQPGGRRPGQGRVESEQVLAQGDPSDEELTHLCERAIRNHDPCISCSTHFLDLTIDRT